MGGNAVADFVIFGRIAGNSAAGVEEAAAEEAAPVAAEGDKVTATAVAQGIGGDVEVQIVADETTIYSVEVLKQNETPGIGSVAVEKLPAAIVEANTYEVDGVSGATVTSTAIRDAVKMALESAGFDPTAYVSGAAPAEAEEPAQAEDKVYDVDVVVVGAGGAGMTAAITAADAGKNVLVLESQGMVGGNSVRSTGGMNAAPTEWQQANEFGETAGVESTLKKVANFPDNARIQELGAVVAEQWAAYQANPEGYFDSAELFQLDTLIGGGGINDPSLVKKLVENSESAIAFLDQLDPEIVLHNVAQFGGAAVKRIHRPVDAEGKTLSVGAYVVPLLQQNLEARGIELLLNTTATEILMDNGTAVGVVAETADGAKVTVNAASVVITSGGFGANNEMIASIRPEL
ncbi:MAG: FAD-dependent oxidoreductase, partial [Lachnospiraceae bacterium]|nr:FAD-dependent oxidoreductase [Lachnospiraceae bacterium]